MSSTMSSGGSAAGEEGSRENPKYVIAVDIGTTSIKCHVYDKATNLQGSSCKPIETIHPHSGAFEIDPDLLWTQFTSSVKLALSDAGLKPDQTMCMGITTQRNTFTLWNKETGKLFHNFVTWQDLRASGYCKLWNSSFSLKSIHGGSKFMHFFTHNKRYVAGSILKYTSPMVPMRLLWMIDSCDGARQCMLDEKLAYGCIETWLLWKLTGGRVFATDYSCASSTGMYDSFQLDWTFINWKLLGISPSILPEVKDTSGYFGACEQDIFGFQIPITAIVADQQSAMFAQGCFNPGDLKVTMGTGSFIDVNTGKNALASFSGLYPLVGWKIGDEITYIAEGNSNDTGSVLEWLKSIELIDDPAATSDIANSVSDSGGVYFIPAFSGLQIPINDDYAVTSLIGMKPTTTKAHIIRAVLESLAFRVKLLYETVLEDTSLELSSICVDGGVTRNDFVMQLIADITNKEVVRPNRMEMTCLGAALLAGSACGIWKNKDEMEKLRQVQKIFKPRNNWHQYKNVVSEWERALKRSQNWYRPT